MVAHTYICKRCDPSRPCVCPDATDEPVQCPIIGDDISEWTIDDTIIIARKFEEVKRDG